MPARSTDDAAAFLRDAAALLRRERRTTNFLATRAANVAGGLQPARPGETWWVVEARDGAAVGAGVWARPGEVFVAGEVAELAGRLEPTEVRGEAAAVAAVTGGEGQVVVRERLLRLAPGTLRPPADVPGSGRLARWAEVEVVARWSAEFMAEAFPEVAPVPMRAVASSRLAAGQWWLWHDPSGAPVAMAGLGGAPFGVGRIGPVYTDPAVRGRGYGGAVTAMASAHALGRGDDEVVLYADAANPVSNHVYEALGYTLDHVAETRRLDRS